MSVRPEEELVRAVKEGAAAKVNELLSEGVDPNLRDEREGYTNVTPLMYAAEKGDVAMIEALLNGGADVKVKDRFVMPSEGGGETALFYAVRSGNVEAIRALVRAGAAVNAKARGYTALTIAVEQKRRDLIDTLLELGADPNAGGSLEDAVREDNVEFARVLLESGANPNKASRDFGTTPLMEAARRGQLEICRTLLHHGADPNGTDKNGSAALMEAATGGVLFQLESEEDWYRYGNDPRLEGSLLQTGRNAAEIIELLASAGADINHHNDYGWTALMNAVFERREDTHKALLKLGASSDGVTQAELFRAMKEGAEGVEIYELARRLPSLDLRGRFGGALWEAAQICAGFPLVKMFVQMGMDPNLISDDGDPLLKEAIQAGNGEFVLFLVEKGADLRVKDAKGGDAKRWARGIKGMTAFIEHLLKEPARPKAQPEMLKPTADFERIVMELQGRFGKKAEQLRRENGTGVTFRLSDATANVEELQADLLKQGAYLFESEYRKAISLLPTTDAFAVVRFMGTNGANYDLDTEDIVTWLKELDQEQPFQLSGIGGDFLRGRFITAIHNARKLAARMYAFCPDIVDQGAGTVAHLASELKKSPEFLFWWD